MHSCLQITSFKCFGRISDKQIKSNSNRNRSFLWTGAKVKYKSIKSRKRLDTKGCIINQKTHILKGYLHRIQKEYVVKYYLHCMPGSTVLSKSPQTYTLMKCSLHIRQKHSLPLACSISVLFDNRCGIISLLHTVRQNINHTSEFENKTVTYSKMFCKVTSNNFFCFVTKIA